MARIRTVDFLPEIFQTSTNKQFLAATLDQLVQEPNFTKIQGFVGRRVGPGVNANDEYVKETTAIRSDYQLEPGVILKNPDDSTKIIDAITYPGITDALNLQGANTTEQDRLYTSDFYTWDPFVDFDKFVNFSQYYWLPGGPNAVDVFSGTVPLQDNFVVDRANGVYTFSGVNGNNPDVTLVRGGNYTFQVAQNAKETVNFRVTNDGTSAWVIDYENNPDLTLVRGNTYTFTMVLKQPLKFYIKSLPTIGTTNVYSTGVENNGAVTGTITFVVPQDAPDILYYVNDLIPNLRGKFNIVNGIPGTGPGFWIQSDPGVNGRVPATPNISSRGVLGVTNNGEDLGTIDFDVPLVTAQNFFYDLNVLTYNGGKIDLVANTSIKFDELNNIFVDQFLLQYPSGIDGIQNLNGRTIVFLNPETDTTPEGGGWEITSQFDPIIRTADNYYPIQSQTPNGVPSIWINNISFDVTGQDFDEEGFNIDNINVYVGQPDSSDGLPGSYDSLPFDYTIPISNVSDQRSVWQIQYMTAGTRQYMQLSRVADVPELTKFTALFGTQYASTQWYKDAEGYFQQIPLLTATKDYLWYQDGTDPEIFGRFRIIDQSAASDLDVITIIGKKNYTSPNGVVFTNGLKVQFTGNVVPSTYKNNQYYVEGVGTAIQLLPVTNYVTPETYTKSATVPYDSTPYDVGNFDASLNQPLVLDYLTINRASPDLNAWTRSNRWFHIDVIRASASYNNTTPAVDNLFRAKRPVLEYRAGTRLFGFGTEGKQPVDIIDFNGTDALTNINGATGYGTDGYNFVTGTRVIFALDSDPKVRSQIYVVEFIVPDPTQPDLPPVINLVPATDATVLINQTVVCLTGNTQQGKSYWFDGVDWILAQQKTKVNQPPLFDVYDAAGISYSDRAKYPSTNFTGSKLFSYGMSAGVNDNVLGFPLKYLSLENIGDIVFDNNLYNDTFIYTKDSVSTTLNISEGFVRQYKDRVVFTKEIGWQPAITKSRSRQQFRFNYDGLPLKLDVQVLPDNIVPSIQIYAGSLFVEPSNYTFTTTSNTTTITLLNTYLPGDVIEVSVLSDQVSAVGFYEVPINLENNPFGVNSPVFTLGTARAHYETIGENLLQISGPINGANNTRDLGNIIPYGTNIVQQSSPMTLAGYFMRSKEYNVFNSIQYSSREYERYKAKLLDTAISNDYTGYTVPNILTDAMTKMIAGRNQLNPFYWTDMLPASAIYQQSTYTFTPISSTTFDLSTTYDFTSSNYQGLLIYVNDQILTFGYDYTVATDGPRVTITSPLAVGDVIVIQEYSTTYGSFVPNTPTKLGLYPAFKPAIYLDTSYVTPTVVILGHDGSKTIAFDDFRDQLLLEFETRIFNNLKIKSVIPLTLSDVVPGQFRETDYTLGEINQILSPDFLTWIGWNKLAYQSQDYIQNNQFTWNYAAAGNRLSGSVDNTRTESPLLIGAWRGIYQYFYDTVSPQITPWEMLGFTQRPDWWLDAYGDAPYTSTNLVLWDDLAEGKVADPAGTYYLPRYARPGLQQVIPVDSEGNLVSPFTSVVGLYDSTQWQKSWVFGDNGPVEYSWRSSSSYPFAVMRLLALTRPAEFFSLFADRDLYKFDTNIGQYLLNERYRLDANGVQVYGNGVSKASYIDWIVDYNQQLGRDSSTQLAIDLANLDVRLCYRMGTFTDKQYLSIYTEKSSPNSLNSSLLLPDDSYNLLVYKNQPFDRVTYSSVIMQIVDGGYAVFGYSITNPYFSILASRAAGTKTILSDGGTEVVVPNTYSNNVVQVPYGYVFTNQTMVCDFLLSYGKLLEKQGLTFLDRENGYTLDWRQMAREFLYWDAQGWAVGSVINLNPSATSLTAYKVDSVVDSIVAQTPENLLLDQNRTTVTIKDLVVDRYESSFKVSSLSEQTISYSDLRYTSYESMVVLDNVSIFNDLIYNPATGARQSRINITATVSADWTGQLDAQGFILNNNSMVQQWAPYKKYAKGEIVIYKNNYWSAQTIVQPSAEFTYSQWVKSDYTKIQGGLLANLPNKADQLANSYNTQLANLDGDNDLLSYGLIGFRPRQYMTDLGLNDVEQVNLYQQFLKDKGTIGSVRLLANANLGKETAQYDVFENWAVQRAVYGANANRSFIELRLNAANLRSDPSVVQVVQPQQTSSADQQILLQSVWRESFKLTSTDILPTTTVTPTDIGLPTAGYVNLDDVDITVFSLDGELELANGVLNTIGIGTTIWAAKSNQYDWNVYRSTSVPGYISTVTSNLDLTSTALFTKQHGLLVNDIVVIRYYSDAVDGVYRVLAVPSLTEIQIAIDLSTTTTSGITVGTGLAYTLRTMRVAQASDVVGLSYSTDLLPGAKAWVDDNGKGLWEVLEKQQPFTSVNSIPVKEVETNSLFGSSIAQGYENTIALVGSPGHSLGGALFPYLRDDTGEYAPNPLLTVDATDIAGYGNAIEIGYQSWAVAGASASNGNQGYAVVIYRAPATNVFDQRALLVAPDSDFDPIEFGHSVTISRDERWMYIGAPAGNKVYSYGRVDVERQTVKYPTDGTNRIFNFNGLIEINDAQQLSVVVNNQLLKLGLDYTINSTFVDLGFTPPAGQVVIVSRKSGQQLDHDVYYNIQGDETSGSGTGAKFNIDRTRGVYTTSLTAAGINYAIGDTITIYGPIIGGGSSPAHDLIITVDSVVDGGITDFTTSGSGVDDTTVFPLRDYLYSAISIDAFTITVDDVYQRPNIDYTYDGFDVTFLTVPVPGAFINVTALDYWKYIGALSVIGLDSDARFGSSISTTTDGRQIIVGAENDNSDDVPRSGSVYAFNRGVERFLINDATQTTYALPTGWNEPVAVLLNNTYLTNTDYYINGQYAVVGDNVVLSSSLEINVGDVLEIENNIFKPLQKFVANSPYDEAKFGHSVKICPNNCSIYVGAPFDGTIQPGAGSVQRTVNQARVYGTITSTIANPTLTAGDIININNTPVAVPTAPNNTVVGLSNAINSSGIPNVAASVADGLLTVSIVNAEAAEFGNKLNVLPGASGTAFYDLGFELYVYTQTITSPLSVASAQFGSSVFVDTTAVTLVVGAPQGSLYEPTTFDKRTTYFDDRSTPFFNPVVQSGAVYTYDYLPAANETASNPGKFVFGQQIYDTLVSPLDQWGTAVDYTSGKLLVGAPGNDLGDSSGNYGRVGVFNNPDRNPTWTIIHIQQPVVDVYQLNSVYMYDRLQSAAGNFFDFFNPLQGKILGAARQNIDYIGSVDPGKYNTGEVNNDGNSWGKGHIGQIWWDTTSTRFIDPNQDDITYASRRWGQLFPGSQVEVYQWVVSSVPPAAYAGTGTPYNTTSYTVNTRLNEQGTFSTDYYFWVRGINTINTVAGKSLSTVGIARYIESPQSSGIPYIAGLNSSTVAIYNGLQFLSAADTILHIEYDIQATDANIHTEFELIAQGKPESFISANLYRKLQDSFCGVNTVGSKVPDPFLSPPERYGVQFRPRQSMFTDRFVALKNYLIRANSILANYPIAETRRFNLLNSSEPEPTEASGEWNMRLINIEQLSYQNLNSVPVGYRYLIVSDSTNNGLWTIYEVIVDTTVFGAPRTTQLYRVQTYDTRNYWTYINWYQPGYNKNTTPTAEVPVYSSLATLTLTAAPVGSSVKVTANAQNKFEIYLRTTEFTWDRVVLEDGTISFNEELWDYAVGRFGFDAEVFDAQYFDQEPTIETRKIIQAINEELFINELAIERNRLLTLVFDIVLSQFGNPEWLSKTSLIDVRHNIRELIPFQIYRRDNQDFVLQYLQEVKPYHVQVRDFNLSYTGLDSYGGMITDFDNPAFYDTQLEIPQFVSPILLPYTKSSAQGTGTANLISDRYSDAEVWVQNPWNEWYNNYLLGIQGVAIINGGTGYSVPPEVTVTGDCITPAIMTAVVNSAGKVIGVDVVDSGSGYSTTALITFVGGNGSGATAYAIMGNELVRSMKTTMKYDRYQYDSPIVEWEANVAYDNGTLVRYDNRVWAADSGDSSPVDSAIFDPNQWLIVPAETLSGVNRTWGFYAPTPNIPGRQLSLLIDGIDYPGVQVTGPLFSQNTGFDVGNYDINPFDNISYDANGSPTYDPAILDAIYESEYLDPYLGTRPTDINVDGGAYVDTYSSHAPEELIPGAEFDTLDFRVYTRPGADWTGDGHGFSDQIRKYVYDPSNPTVSFAEDANSLAVPVAVIVSNQSSQDDLDYGVDYTVDWVNQTITLITAATPGGVNAGDVVVISTYELGGGNQLFKQNYNGADIGDTVLVPVSYTEIQEIAVFVNGVYTTDLTYVAVGSLKTRITFGSTYGATDAVAVIVIGPTIRDGVSYNYSWSAPCTQEIVGNGSLVFNLDNSLIYTNPDNLVVTVNGIRARTSAGIEWYGDGSTEYLLPDRLGFSQQVIADPEVRVYINDVPQVLGINYSVTPYDPLNGHNGRRSVVFFNEPALGDRILIAVYTNTQCYVNGSQLQFIQTAGLVPQIGDLIAVTTWNDTRQQNILTQVYVGPIKIGTTVEEGYDATDFDFATISGEPGSFDYAAGKIIEINNFDLGRTITDPSRLWVTINGRRLFSGVEFNIVGQELVLFSGPIQTTDVVMITMFTNSVVPKAMAFRIFQDMRGIQATYRITPQSTTTLAQTLLEDADIVYVTNASNLSEPALSSNVWGVVTINGERIMYRTRNTTNNTISGLLRGTAGTAVADHIAGTEVYDMGRGNILSEQFQNYIVSDTTVANGTELQFYAPDINLIFDSAEGFELLPYDAGNVSGEPGSYDYGQGDPTDQVEVYVGGTQLFSGFSVISSSPVSVLLEVAPPEGVEVTILVRRGVTWYNPGAGTASDGVPLQETNNQIARFLRGE
jgi:hypothetical protein